MSSSFIKDNYKNGKVGDFLKEAIAHDSELSIVSAYFTIYAYARIKDKLDSIKHLRFLFGEPTFLKSIDPEKTNTRDFQIEDDQLQIPLESRLEQKSIARECRDWLSEKAEIRSMVKPNFLHGKMYHITQASGVEKAIVGSSNFTVSGLGLGNSNNIELNTIVDGDRDRQELRQWFDSIWNDQSGLVEDVKEQVLGYLDQLYAENEPEFIYFKTLYHIFYRYLDEQSEGGLLNEKTGFYDSEIWNKLYEFQKDGVRGAINKILKHNGCIIADSVGLGKTFEALAIIKYFELLNERVLVLCPKKLTGNWTIYQASKSHALNPFEKDRFNYTVLYHTDMGRERGRSDADGIDLENFNWGAYDLVVIDESHNFRGNPAEKEKKDGSMKMNRALWLMEKVIKSGSRTRVLMLSATPVNNALRDLRNQIAFITEGNDQALMESTGIRDIAQTLRTAQSHFTSWADPNKNPNRILKQLLERLDSSFFKLLDELTIARSRKHIVNFYDQSRIGRFPRRNKPQAVYSSIDLLEEFPSYDAINRQIETYRLSVFNPSAYVKPEMQKKYEDLARGSVMNFTQSQRENFLIGMMKVNFLKRLESSIESFEISMHRTVDRIKGLIEKIEHFQESGIGSQQESLDQYSPPEEEWEDNSDETEEWQVGKKLKFDLADLDLDTWLRDLSRDKDALVGLMNNARAVGPERDAKLKELKDIIQEKVSHPRNEDNKKVLVFTAFADTAQYLYDNLADWIRQQLGLHAGLVCGSYTKTTYGRNDYDSILVNFSPRSKDRDRLRNARTDAEIDILIATDCISEGQNLQDCDCLINYDIHWNPVRIIQRFGRIDRLGSTNETIHLINFWPTKDLDNYINLKDRVESRMALVDVTATGEDNILNPEQIRELITDDLKYRNQQLKRLRDEVLDLEDMDESISLTDFTLDDFRIELMNYLQANEARLRNSPLGLYAVVPAPGGEHAELITDREVSGTEKEKIKPGVIFCLSHKEETEGNTEVNPLNPFFLVYIRDDGTVRYNYTQAKHILEAFRLLCQGTSEPWQTLCDLFNQETNHGSEMNKYTDLMQRAVNAVVQIYRKKGALKLSSDRGAVIVPKAKQISDSDDFELITWLVIK